MNNEKKNFPEQEAPAKNTDNAFVQVSHDGSPHIPHEEVDKEEISSAKDEEEKQSRH